MKDVKPLHPVLCKAAKSKLTMLEKVESGRGMTTKEIKEVVKECTDVLRFLAISSPRDFHTCKEVNWLHELLRKSLSALDKSLPKISN